MSKIDFDNFLKKEEKKKVTKINWNEEKKKWFFHLDNLYSDIKDWLKEYVDSKKIQLEFNDIEIYEEALGTYKVQELTIIIGDKIAKLTPIGTILIGTPGRVDLSGRTGTARFILTDKNATAPNIDVKIFSSEEEKSKNTEDKKTKIKPVINWVWKITSNPPRIKYTELNQDTFLQCLMEVVDDQTI